MTHHALALLPHMLQLATILSVWRAWQEAQSLSQRTINEREYTLKHFCETTGAAPLAITPDDVVMYISRPRISQGTKATYHKHLRAYHRWLIKTGRRADNPMLDTPQPKQPKGLPRPLAEEELAALLRTVNRKRTRMMILLAALQGLRVHEIAKLSGQDIDLADMSLTVTGKGNKTAILPLHAQIAAEAAHFPTEGPWFPSYQRPGEPVTAGAVSAAIGSVMKRAGMKRKPHQLRHWYGTTLVQSGTDIRVVQELMRHESLATTQIYTLVNDRQRRAGIDRLSLPAAS